MNAGFEKLFDVVSPTSPGNDVVLVEEFDWSVPTTSALLGEY